VKPSKEIRDLVLGYFHDFANADPASTLLFSESDDTVVIGMDPTEFYVGGPQIRALLKKQLEEIGPSRVESLRVLAFEEGTVGWASGTARWTVGDGPAVDARMTFVMRREDAGWKAVHTHASVGLPNVELVGVEMTTAIEDVADLVERERPDVAPLASPEGTVTIMFTDIEASTATNEALGDDVFMPLLLRHNEIVRSHTERAGGTVVKAQGDGFMIAFPSARRGVECAIAIQQAVADLDAALKVRMGLHTGEPVRQADDFYGRDVAYAARIGAEANGGEILVSSLVRSLVEPTGSFVFASSRESELKGFDGPQAVWQVQWRAPT
jgi:class 3 adenylate cyclase